MKKILDFVDFRSDPEHCQKILMFRYRYEYTNVDIEDRKPDYPGPSPPLVPHKTKLIDDPEKLR